MCNLLDKLKAEMFLATTELDDLQKADYTYTYFFRLLGQIEMLGKVIAMIMEECKECNKDS